jgi:hypothetical protein
MRKATFEVPSSAMAQFADGLSESNLENSITGTNKFGEIIVEVMYKKSESEMVDKLEAFLDKITGDDDDDSDDDE